MAEQDSALVVAMDRCLSPVDTVAEARLARWTGLKTAAADLPLDASLLKQVQARAAAGQRIYLGAEVDQPAQELAQHLGLFQGIILSDAAAGETLQAAAQRELSGEVELWVRLGPPGQAPWRHQWRALRPHYWAKSLLVFLPLIAARQWDDGAAWIGAAMAFAVMSLASSAVYLLNDLWDLSSDRRDPLRRDRPIASGRVGVGLAVRLALICLGVSFAIAGIGGSGLLVAATAYVAGAFVYSLRLKFLPYIDVSWLAMLHTMRIVAGGIASGIPPSGWLIALSLMLFGSLACAKRVSELALAAPERGKGRRPYGRRHLSWLVTIGLGAGAGAGGIVLAYAWAGPGSQLYPHPAWLIGAAFCLLVWLARIWRAALTGHLGTDPILFALRDSISWSCAAALAMSLWGAAS